MNDLAVEGRYRESKVELMERPSQVEEAARVLVTLLPRVPLGKRGPDESQDRDLLRQRAFARANEGIRFGGPPYPMWEELDDRLDREQSMSTLSFPTKAHDSLDGVTAGSLPAVRPGEVLTPRQPLDHHPDHAQVLRAFFADLRSIIRSADRAAC